MDAVVSAFPHKKILVLGDVMLDEYVYGSVSRISPEAPVPVVEVQQSSFMPGGAGNVAVNVASLGGRVCLGGVMGTDEAAGRLKAAFGGMGVELEGLKQDEDRPTTLKTRVVAHNQQVVRMDREAKQPISERTMRELYAYVLDVISSVDAVLVSDYGKGVVTIDLLAHVFALAKNQRKPVIVDPKGRDFSKYWGATVITPNRVEAAMAVQREIIDEDSLVEIGRALLDQGGFSAVLITRGEEGMSLVEGNGETTHIPACAREVYDVTGAGDTVVGTLALCLASGASMVDSARLANLAAGIVVGKLGTATVAPEELQQAWAEQGRLRSIRHAILDLSSKYGRL